MTENPNAIPHKHLAAVCGLFCPSCSIYISSQEDPVRLQSIAERRGISAEEAHCDGCRSERRYPFCNSCKMYTCAAEKGYEFCGECTDFPCEDVRAFQSILPHRLELYESQKRIQDAGYETWYREMLVHFACPQCGTLNSAYDQKCRACGAEPANTYNAIHKEEMAVRLAASKR